MAATISESYLSRPFTLGRTAGRELVYDIQGTDDEGAVQTLLAATAPTSYAGLRLEALDAEPLGGGIWKGHARYARLVDDSEYTFDTGGGTAHVTQSLATVARYGLDGGDDPPDFQGAIGVSEDSVEGTDVPVRKFEFSETHQFSDADITGDYKRLLFLMTGRWNDADFKGLAAGECLFLGASGSKRGDELWSITFRFAGSENVFGLTIGGTTGGDPYDDPEADPYGDAVITGIDKLGWDYLWIRYADFEDETGKALVKRPVAAYVERVSEPGDFSLLGIGV